MDKMTPTTASAAIMILLIAGCSSGGDGGTSSTIDTFYEPMSEQYVNEKFGETGYTVDALIAHTDGLGNSELDIADLNIVAMDRAVNGDIFIAYDAMIYAFGFDYLNPDVWGGSTRFRLYIDNDNDANTGYPINGIGADIQLANLGQYIWNPATSNWDSTWFESAPPLGGIRISGGGEYEITSDINTGETYFRSTQRINYLDALAINTDAKGVVQILYDVVESSGLNIVEVSLDSTSPFEMPDL